MSSEVSMLKPTASNPATNPVLTEALQASVLAKKSQVLDFLQFSVQELGAGSITFANSFGAEDFATCRRISTSIVFQDLRLFTEQTVLQNLEIKRQLA